MGFLHRKKSSSSSGQPQPMADEDHRSALTDEEDSSYGPVPPPPPDGNEVAAAQEQYDLEQNQQEEDEEEEDEEEEEEEDEYMDMPDKNDPPSQDQDVTMDVSADEFASTAEEDDDMSVEIPPTSIVQRMLASEKNHEYDEDEKGGTLRMGRVLGVVACCLAILAIILGAGFGTGAFTKDKSSNSDPSDSSGNADGSTGGNGGGELNNPMRAEDINLFLASVTFVPSDEFDVEGSAQQQAVNWLITEDPMQLGTDTVADQIRLSQRFALLSLYFSDPNKEWTAAEGWLVDADECNWEGVTCTEQAINGEPFNAVSRFDMRGNNVAAPLPADFALLENMTTLNLAGNQMTGGLPASYGTMSNLVVLVLEANLLDQDLTGYSWDGMTTLTELRLSSNDFSGDLTSLAVLAPTLIALDLANNVFEFIPDAFSAFINLAEFNVDSNRMTGPIPDAVGSMVNLRVLHLGNNSWDEGDLPIFIYTLSELIELGMEECNLTGVLEGAIASLTNLQNLNLNGNSLGGGLPNNLNGMTALRILSFSDNAFTGPIPDNLDTLQNLTALLLDGNVFTGGFPSSVTSILTLEFLDLSSNALSGGLPVNMGAMFNLRGLYLNSQITPDIVGSGFTGALPDSLGNLGNLERLNLRANLFNGTLPTTLGGLDSLVEVVLRFNDFSGEIPAEIADWGDTLEEADFTGNGFTGALPEGICGDQITLLVVDCTVECSCCTEDCAAA